MPLFFAYLVFSSSATGFYCFFFSALLFAGAAVVFYCRFSDRFLQLALLQFLLLLFFDTLFALFVVI